jgi:uncharacterized membrane protein
MAKLLRKRLVARILIWVSMVGTVVPLSAALFGFLWYRYTHSQPLAGLDFFISLNLWWPVPVVAAITFVLSLEWKQGLDKRIKEMDDLHARYP